jgi:hypothetical protein
VKPSTAFEAIIKASVDDSDDETPSEGGGHDNGDSGDEDNEAEAEIVEIAKQMKDMANQLQDLANIIHYNAQYADPRALTLFTKKRKMQ